MSKQLYRYRQHFDTGPWQFCENEPQHVGEWEPVTTTRPNTFMPVPVGMRYRRVDSIPGTFWTYVDLESLMAGLNLATDQFVIESLYTEDKLPQQST